MGLFSRSSRRDYPTHNSTHTGSHNGIHNGSHTDTGYNNDLDNGAHNGVSHDSGRHGRHRGKYSEKHRGGKRPLFDIHSGNYNRRPSFGTWLKYTWLDILTMIAMGAVGLGVYEADPAPSRSFPVTFSNGEIVYPQFAYPLRHEIIPIWAAAMLGSLVPIFVILVMQIRIKSFWDVNNAVIGLLYSLIGAAVFQVFVKWLIGGLRPHFLSVCQPDPAKVIAGGDGFLSIMFHPDICTGDRNQINDSLESMPSGHSTAAWAGLLYLYFYLNGKLKVFSNYHPAMWKLILLYAPLLGATLITGALTIDEFHNWYDCLAGAIIGSVFAISSYRMVYASVWDFRFNHIPLTRHTPFSYGAGPSGAGGFETCVFTHSAGWGYEEAYGGAPFDSAYGLRSGGGGGALTHGEHTIGLGHKNEEYRHGDVEHNAATTGPTTNTTTGFGNHHNHNHNHNHTLGHHNTTTATTPHSHGLGHHHNNTTGVNDTRSGYGNPLTQHTGTTGTTGMTGMTGTTGTTGLTTHNGPTEGEFMREGRSSTTDPDNRYRSHRKSLERKALAGGARHEPTY